VAEQRQPLLHWWMAVSREQLCGNEVVPVFFLFR
jgi:hypothetical protein